MGSNPELLRTDAMLEDDRRRARRLERRRAFYFVALAVPLFVVADLLIVPAAVRWTLALRLGWSALLVLLALRMPQLSHPRYRLAVAVGAAGSSAFYLAICAVSGEVESPLFAWNLAVPLAIAVVAKDEVAAVVAGVVTSLLGAGVLMVVWQAPLHTVAVWSTLLSASASVAIYTAVAYRRMHLAELAIDDARLAALRQLADSELRRSRSERLAVLGRLSAGVAHELNNPLNLLMMSVETLERYPSQLSDETKRQQRVAAIREAAERIAAIAMDLRSYAREPQVEQASASPEEVVDAALRLSWFRLKNVATVQRDLTAGLPPVAMGPRHLSQVLVNLLVNAGDALEGRSQPAPVISIRARAEDGSVVLVVEDNGPGIPGELMPRLFREPVTTKPGEKGTGLGLTLSREYVEQAGGAIFVENRPEGGARFTVRVNAVRAPG